MQVTGQIFLGDDDSRLLPITIVLDGVMSIVTPDGRRIGTVKPEQVEISHVAAERFRLDLGGRVYGFLADDPNLTLDRFLGQLTDGELSCNGLPDPGEPPARAHDSHDRPDGQVPVREQSPVGTPPDVESADPHAMPATEGDRADTSGGTIGEEGPPPDRDQIMDSPVLISRGGEFPGTASHPDRAVPEAEKASSWTPVRRRQSTAEELSSSLIGFPRSTTDSPRTRAAVARLSKTEQDGESARERESRHLLRSTAARSLNIDGHNIAYRESGRGRPIVLIGGGFGSMHAWFDVTAALNEQAHSIAIDLLGFGESDRLPGRDISGYSWDRHVDLLDESLERLGLDEGLTLMSYGLNAIPALMLARRRADRIRAIGYIEAVLRPLAWHELGPWIRDAVKSARSQDDDYFLDSDRFLSEALEEFAAESLDPAITASHRRAMGPIGSGRTAYMAALANIPVGGNPSEVRATLADAYQWLKGADLPKLLVLGEPGYFLVRRSRKLAVSLANQTVVVVPGRNLLLETASVPVTRAITDWLKLC